MVVAVRESAVASQRNRNDLFFAATKPVFLGNQELHPGTELVPLPFRLSDISTSALELLGKRDILNEPDYRHTPFLLGLLFHYLLQLSLDDSRRNKLLNSYVAKFRKLMEEKGIPVDSCTDEQVLHRNDVFSFIDLVMHRYRAHLNDRGKRISKAVDYSFNTEFGGLGNAIFSQLALIVEPFH